MARRRSTVIAIEAVMVVAIVLVGVFAYRAIAGGGSGSTGALRTSTVARGTVLETVSASGTIVSPLAMDLNFSTQGTVTAISVKTGQQVTKGELLAKEDASAARQQLVSARSSLAAAQANLASVEAASPTAAQLTQAQSQVESARLAKDQAQSQLEGTVLRAPFSGTVVSIDGTVGETVSGGGNSSASTSSSTASSSSSGFMVVADLANLEVAADFSETDIAKLKVGQTATVTFNALPGQQVAGTVETIDPTSTVVNNVVDFGVTIKLSSQPEGIRPGQTATIQVVAGEADNALYVPAAAVQTAGGSSTVIVLRNGQQVRTVVTLGLQGSQTTQIVAGLSEGEQVVIPSATGSGGFPGGGFPGGGVGGGVRGGGG